MGAAIGKRSVRYRQFQGGYARVPEGQLKALMTGYREGVFRRDEVRVFAGRHEQAALHRESRVSLYRVVNADSRRKGNRRMSHREIERAGEKLDRWLPRFQGDEGKRKPVARRALRHIARGGATTAEALFLFAYFSRRIAQRKPMRRLESEEHYARFRYAEFETWTGLHRATQSRLLPRLIARGFLGTVGVHKQNENAYGQVFIDGPVLSLVRRRQALPPKAEKRSTPSTESINAPKQERSTLRNPDPKTPIRKAAADQRHTKLAAFADHPDAEMRRIGLRARQMLGVLQSQAA